MQPDTSVHCFAQMPFWQTCTFKLTIGGHLQEIAGQSAPFAHSALPPSASVGVHVPHFVSPPPAAQL